MSDLHKKLTAEQLGPAQNPAAPTPVPLTNAPANADNNFNNQNWNTLRVGIEGATTPVTSSLIDNPGVAQPPPTSSPVTAPSTSDPARIITTADARQTVQWPDGSYKPYVVNQTAEQLAYGTGPLYENAGGFGSNENSGGTGPGQTYNSNSFTPGVGFPLNPNPVMSTHR